MKNIKKAINKIGYICVCVSQHFISGPNHSIKAYLVTFLYSIWSYHESDPHKVEVLVELHVKVG